MIDFKSVLEKNPVVLAPMAGITNRAYREFMKPFGVSFSYTEMVSDCGLIYENKETYRYLDISKDEGPIGIQLFGGSKETLLKALDIIQKMDLTYDFIDINLGCPVNKVVKTNAGSAWLKRPEELKDMMKALVDKSKTPVSAKIRIGWDEKSINVSEIVEILQDCGVSLIAIHPRTRNEFYSGIPHYDMIKDIKKIMKVPLLISGDIFSLKDAIKWMDYTNADGVMLARGALGNPFLISQIKTYYEKGVELEGPSIDRQIDYLMDYASRLVELKGEYLAIRELKGIATHFIKGFPNSKRLKVELTTKMETLEDLKRILGSIER